MTVPVNTTDSSAGVVSSLTVVITVRDDFSGEIVVVEQGCQTYGSQARTGPPRGPIGPIGYC